MNILDVDVKSHLRSSSLVFSRSVNLHMKSDVRSSKVRF